MFSAAPLINIQYDQIPGLGKAAYIVDGIEHNPTITVVRGQTYKIRTQAPTEHLVWLKTALGSASTNAYIPGVTNNGTPEVYWRVPTNAPARLVYQSWSNPTVAGAIRVVDQPQPIPTGINTFGDLKAALDQIEQHLITNPADIAGLGLTISQGKLTLADTYPAYLIDTNQNIYTTQSLFPINDQAVNLQTAPTDLQSWINWLASALRAIKGTPAWDTPTTQTLEQLQDAIFSLSNRLAVLEGGSNDGGNPV